MDRNVDLNIGDRVVIKGHWEFADGIVGTIVLPPDAILDLTGDGEWQGHKRRLETGKGTMISYFVEFDEPQDDGSGDGPYQAAEIDEDSLMPLIRAVPRSQGSCLKLG
jgi:hypothetical protein